MNEMYAMSHRILIVDDDPHIRQVLAFALGKAGMQTAEASDGEDALQAIASRPNTRAGIGYRIGPCRGGSA